MTETQQTRWEALLARGEHFQNVWLEQLDLSGWKVEIAKGKFKDWDIRLTKLENNYELLVEVKSDTKSKYTGNIAIECSCSGVPSGIDATKAHYWIHFVPTTSTYYQIPTKVLRKKIADNAFLFRAKGGDGGRAEMYVFAASSFEKYKRTTINPC